MSESLAPDWAIYFPLLWIGGWITASVIFRRIHGRPILPRMPSGARYSERMASGWDDGNWLRRLGGANRCLMVAITERELIVTPFFPFNLLFLPEIYGLELRVPLASIRNVEPGRRLFRDCMIVETTEGRRLGLILRNPQAFMFAARRL